VEPDLSDEPPGSSPLHEERECSLDDVARVDEVAGTPAAMLIDNAAAA